VSVPLQKPSPFDTGQLLNLAQPAPFLSLYWRSGSEQAGRCETFSCAVAGARLHGYDARVCSSNSMREIVMLSARNQFRGTVKSVKLGNVMAEVVVTVGGLEIVSAITRGSAEQMGLKAGDQVTAIIKSTEVLVGKD
jgi:molybdopterin-binding protein